MPDPEKQEPKLIVDEDWKEAVQREKEQAAKPKEQGSAAAESAPAPDAPPSDATPAGESARDESARSASARGASTSAGASSEAAGLPPASFELLVTTLATQAMMALGQLPDPSGQPGKVEKPIAKHYIDMLGVLEEKCKGNLSDGEQKLISEVLHNLRMGFVATR